MLDGILIANEVVEEAKKGGKDSMVFKVYFEKACYLVSRNFLYYMVGRLQFCQRWIRRFKVVWG